MRLTLQEVAVRYRVSEATIWRWLKLGDIPAPVRTIGRKRIGWQLSTLEAWEQAGRPAQITNTEEKANANA